MKQWNSSHQHFSGGLLTSQKQVAVCDLQKWKLTSVSAGNLETDDVPGEGHVKRPVLKTVPWREPRSWDRKVCKTYQISKWLNKQTKIKMLQILQRSRTLTVQGNHKFLPPHPSPWLFLEVLLVWSLVVCWVPAGGYLNRRIPCGTCDQSRLCGLLSVQWLLLACGARGFLRQGTLRHWLGNIAQAVPSASSFDSWVCALL